MSLLRMYAALAGHAAGRVDAHGDLSSLRTPAHGPVDHAGDGYEGGMASDAAVVQPSLVCRRCEVAFESAHAYRRHFRDTHMGISAPERDVEVAAAVGAGEAGSASASSGSDAEDDGVGRELEVAAADTLGNYEEEDDGSMFMSRRGHASARMTADGYPIVHEGRALVRVVESGELCYVFKCLLETCGDSSVADQCRDRMRPAAIPVRVHDLLRAGETWAVFMFQSGFFAAAVFQVSPFTDEMNPPRVKHVGEPYPRMLLHRRFHRYTTRRKQGGSQTAHDAARGAPARSAGAQLRRAGEQHLLEDIDGLLHDPAWVPALAACRRIFLAAPKVMRQMLFNEDTLRRDDPRVAPVPCTYDRPSVAETARICDMLTTVLPAAPLRASLAAAETKSTEPSAAAVTAPITAGVRPECVAVARDPIPPVTVDDIGTQSSDLQGTPPSPSAPRRKRHRNRASRRAKPASRSAPVAAKDASSGTDSEADLLAAAMAQASEEAVELQRSAEAAELEAETRRQFSNMVGTTSLKLRMPKDVLLRALLQPFVSRPVESAAAMLRSADRGAIFSASEGMHELIGLVNAGASISESLGALGWDTLAAGAAAVAVGAPVNWEELDVTRRAPSRVPPAASATNHAAPARAAAVPAHAVDTRTLLREAAQQRIAKSGP